MELHVLILFQQWQDALGKLRWAQVLQLELSQGVFSGRKGSFCFKGMLLKWWSPVVSSISGFRPFFKPMGDFLLVSLASVWRVESWWDMAQLGWESISGLEILWLRVQPESLSPAETNPFLEVAVRTNLEAFLKCHFFSYCRNLSSAFILLFPESVPTHWFKEKQFQRLNSWVQEFPSITANPVPLLLVFSVCSNFLLPPDGWLEVLAGLWLTTKLICFSKRR